MGTKRVQIRKSVRKKVLEKKDSKCAYCGRKLKYEQLTIDHLRPLDKCGKNRIDNYLPACAECNHFKRNLTKGEYRLLIRNLIGKTELTPEEQKIYKWYELNLYKKSKDFKFFFERNGVKRNNANRVVIVIDGNK